MSEHNLTLDEFLSRFPTEEDCANYLFQVKWPHGFVCPRCSHHQAYKTSTRRLPIYECTQCRHQTSLTVGTVMEGSRTALRKWLTALFLVSHDLCGISALKLSKIINVTYKTAWLMLHKIRHAMSDADASILLSGLVHVNDACYGKPYNSTWNKHPQEHPLLVGATLNDREEPVYIKMKLLPAKQLKKRYIHRVGRDEFVKQYVQSGSTKVKFTLGRYISQKAKKLFPHFANANRWINQTFHGLGPRYLQAYFNEFCYRLNRKLQKASIFESLANLCMSSQRITYAALTRW
ncbi:transposase [Ammoniphilus sp. 3BR4]|uniref:transposase n=1 Tax=Ammoniphilus sp. 3BR4 TaxID=3158265 RepID=UPI0034656408